MIGIVCPGIVYPYLRANIADLITRTGLPPINLAEINFEAFYQQRMAAVAQQRAQAVAAPRPTATARPTPEDPMTNVAVLGAGAWGTAMACALAARHRVVLYARDPRQAQRHARTRAATSATCAAFGCRMA